MTLSATVQKLRNQDNDSRAITTDRDTFIAAWQKDVEVLYDRFAAALKPFVDDGAAQTYTGATNVSEEAVGSYPIKMLTIEIIGKRMFLVPIARVTIGGTGRVDLFREDRPSEDSRVLIVRGAEDAGYDPNEWLIQDKKPRSGLPSGLAGTVEMSRGKRQYQGLSTMTIQQGIDYVLNL